MGLVAMVAEVFYRLFSLFPQRKKIVFLSRQSAHPFDFVLLEPRLRERFPDHRIEWCCVGSIGRMGPALMLHQLWHTATAELCLVDGYVPAVSLPSSHRAFVMQVWHAPGAIKKFGYQSLDTPAGRSSRAATTLRMHRGYNLVVAGMPGAVGVFSQAFGVPAQKILPLGLPRIDYLRSSEYSGLRTRRYAKAERAVKAAFEGTSADDEDAITVLYAPTFRKANEDPLWFDHAVDALRLSLANARVRLVVAGHPLEHTPPYDHLGKSGAPFAVMQGIPTIDLLHMADFVVTDYSTVAFEAGYAGHRVLFFVPDVEEYRRSPGLNIDPLTDLPTLSFTSADALAEVLTGEKDYDAEAFAAFMEENAQGVFDGAVDRIVELLGNVLEPSAAEVAS